MKKLLLLLILIPNLLMADQAGCEGEANLELIKAGKKTMEQLTSSELTAVMVVLYGRKCDSNGSCSDAYSSCKEYCSKYISMSSQSKKCIEACRAGERGCSSEDEEDERCDAFEEDCNRTCEDEFYMTEEEGLKDSCKEACSNGNMNCF